MTRNQRYGYTTADEASFIDSLGTQSEVGKFIGPLRSVNAYIEAAKKRSNWGSIDGKVAIDYAIARARELRRNVAEARGLSKTFTRSANQ